MRNIIPNIIPTIILVIAIITAPTLTTRAQSAHTSSFDVDGIKVIYKPTVKQIVNVSIYFRGGVSNYPIEKAGIEKLALNGVLDCGNAKYRNGIFKEKADGIGAQLYASADLDNGSLSLNCITKYFNEGWDLLAAAATTPLFDTADFGIMKQKQIGGLQMQDGNPDSKLRTLAFSTAFRGTPYATNPQGTITALSALTATEAKEYYLSTLLSKSRIFIVVVGNVTKEDITARIKSAFSAIPAGNYTPPQIQVPTFGQEPMMIEERAIATNYILGIVNAPPFSSHDYVPFMLAYSDLQGWMYSEIRIRQHLSYAPSASVHASILPYGDLYVSTTDPKVSVETINRIMKVMKSKNIDNRSLNQIKALYITGNYKQQQSTNALAEKLGQCEILGDWEFAEYLPDMIRQTTRKEMSEAFNKYVTGISWTYLGDRNKAEEAREAFDKPLN